LTPAPDEFLIESLDLEAKGIAHRADGKVVFIEGALPFERVLANVYRKKPSFEQATTTKVLRPSAQRVLPACIHFGLHAGACGGCKMQHMHAEAQVAVKQRALEDALWHLGKVKAANILRPISGPAWGYRYRARLSVRHVPKKGAVLVGFHERNSRYVADIRGCEVLPAHVSALLLPLRELIGKLEARDSCPQIELACGDDVTALVLRHLAPLSGADADLLRGFAACHGAQHAIQWWLQPQGPDTVRLLDPTGRSLSYTLPEFGILVKFKPTDFTQVNPYINQVLVSRALRLLDARRGERVIDWFCGLGNFSLPLATQASEVLGIEGSAALVARAQENLLLNQGTLAGRESLAPVRFAACDLFELTSQALVALGHAHKWLVDPPREGAFALAKALADIHQGRFEPGAWTAPARIVYVSCNPATLARDAGLLVHQGGYECRFAGVINMFAHTAHVESMAVFDRAS
jgi:23S rRNA (uracil1939-C5)-methyltransferase